MKAPIRGLVCGKIMRHPWTRRGNAPSRRELHANHTVNWSDPSVEEKRRHSRLVKKAAKLDLADLLEIATMKHNQGGGQPETDSVSTMAQLAAAVGTCSAASAAPKDETRGPVNKGSVMEKTVEPAEVAPSSPSGNEGTMEKDSAAGAEVALAGDRSDDEHAL